MMKVYHFMLLLGCLMTTLYSPLLSAAQLVDVRTGEVGQKSRIVLVTDENMRWSSAIVNDCLVLTAPQVQTTLPTKMRALRANQIGAIDINATKHNATIQAKLLQTMRIVSTQQLAAKSGQPARWVVDLEPTGTIAKTAAVNNLVAQAAKVATKPVVMPVASKISMVTKQVGHKASAPAIDKHTEIETLAKTPQASIEPLLSQTAIAPDVLSIKPFKGTKELVIAIDAGHGGKDVGATSISGALEKDMTLAMAKELKRQIDAQPGMRAVLTRDDDYFLPLGRRPQLAREMGADLFISLHADSYKDSKISGASFYVMSFNGATSQLAKFVAAHSNSAESNSVMPDGAEPWNANLASALGRMAMNASIEDSHKLGNFLTQGFRKSGIRLQHTQVQAANFVVLKNIDMPSVLIEMGFISNPQQDQLIQNKHYQAKLATSIVNGLVSFVQVQPEPGVVYANLKTVKGDTLASLAQRHSTTVAYLAKANGLSEKGTLKVGQQLRIPVNMTRRVAMLADTKG
jgi:N-acetylmuramoyl-L-alanine amidase